jgi:hypothetical protein
MSQSLLQALAPLLGANGVVNFIFAKTESGYSLVVMPDESIGKSLPELANGVTICGDVEAIEAKIPELAAYSVRVMSTFDTLAQAEAESKAALAAKKAEKNGKTVTKPALPAPKTVAPEPDLFGSGSDSASPVGGLFGGAQTTEVLPGSESAPEDEGDAQ